MLAAVDVQYRDADSTCVAACITFERWTDAEPTHTETAQLQVPAPYVPGQLYLRELPGVLAVLKKLSNLPEVVVVDGYVWLGRHERPGLGAHLYEALGRKVAVIGVAKNYFAGSAPVEVYRGRSVNPLYVTAVGIDEREAARHVEEMHGEARVPRLLRWVDGVCRGVRG